MRFQALLASALMTAATCTEVKPATDRPCDSWQGAYVGHLVAEDTVTGLPTALYLDVQQDRVGWNITGGGVPEIILEAEQYRCTGERLTGTFSGSQDMRGTFTLRRIEGSFVFDARDIGNGSDSRLNFLGYVPQRPIRVRKTR